jgi:hypothetical protein
MGIHSIHSQANRTAQNAAIFPIPNSQKSAEYQISGEEEITPVGRSLLA